MSRTRRPRTVVLSLLVAGVVSACSGGPAVTAPPSVSPTASASADAEATPSPTPTPDRTPDPAAVATACLTLGDIDCQRAAGLARQVLTEADPPLVYVQVGPFGCAEGDRCPTTLDARPEGDVLLEFADGTGLTVHLRVADGSVQSGREAFMGVSVEPSSPLGLPAGPQPFTLGHCGIFSGIDADGSWWDPVGPVDMDSGDAVNATTGVLNLTDPTHGSFVAPSGFAIQLERRDGAKLLPMCM